MARDRVALATCAAWPELDEDGPALRAALDHVGVSATPAVWDDPAQDWAAYDLVVVRSTWDYVPRRDEFVAWAAGVPRLANPSDVLAWNTDKRYLLELAAAGVPVVPTTVVAPGQMFEVPSYEHVVKPTVSANARDTRRFAAGEDSSGHAGALLAAGRSVLVQPYLSRVDGQGETAVVQVLGEHSHAARKAAVLGPGEQGPEILPRQASAAELEVAAQVLAALPFPDAPLYARIDLVPGEDGRPVLMEAELTEPSLFLSCSAGAADRLAAGVRRLLG